jgi:hypothetical protein
MTVFLILVGRYGWNADGGCMVIVDEKNLSAIGK